MASVLRVKDKDGNVIDIPAIKGEKGEDGYTPIKGVDYFDGEKGEKGDPYTLTEADKETIVNAVIDALPVAEGVGF